MFRRLRSLKLFAFSLIALVVVIGAETGQVVAESFLVAEEDQMLSMVNDHRAGRGVQPLRKNDAFRWVARRHTKSMVNRGTIFHNPNLSAEADDAIPGWRMLGENVGMGTSVESVQEAFLRSDRHRANIENSGYNTAGIGGAAAANGRLYFTQNFAAWSDSTPPPPPPTAPPPPPAAPPPTAPPANAAPGTAPPSTPGDAPDPATPNAPTPSNEATPDSTEGPSDASGADGDEDGEDGEGRAGFFEVILGLLARFVEMLGGG